MAMKLRRLGLLIVSICLFCSACTSGETQPGTDAIDGTSDIGMASRELEKSEKSKGVSSINLNRLWS